jgi:TPR repeat protein
VTNVPPDAAVHNAAALYERGVAMHDRGAYTAAEQLWRQAAEAGHTDAQFDVGMVLHERGDTDSLAQSEQLWRSAANAGHARAQYNLGCLLDDRGDEDSVVEAEWWWRAAADARHSGARRNVDEITEHSPQKLANL